MNEISKEQREKMLHLLHEHDRFRSWVWTGDEEAAFLAIRSLIESSGEKTIEKGGKDVTQFIHPDGEIDWVKPRCSPAPLLKGEFERRYGKPAPSPGPSAKEVEEAMFRMEMFANCHGSKDEVADAAVIRAALAKQGLQAGYCEMCKGTGEVDGPLEDQRLPCPGPKHRPAPTSGEREEE